MSNNIFCDLGNLLVSDTNPINKDYITEDEILEKATANASVFFGELYNLLKTQKGNDDEHRDFDKDPDNVTLPKGQLILPRARKIPKEKPLTRWEKFRLEKGLPPRKKRSRMVFSELTNDWVPRWGKGSVKKVEDKTNWAIEEKQGDNYNGEDPFTLRNREKKFQAAKQQRKELKNKLSAKEQNDLKQAQKTKKLKTEKNLLNKTLEVAQKSTVTMGNFDKKLKDEPEIKKPKKKVNASLFDKKNEKERNSKILRSVLEKNK